MEKTLNALVSDLKDQTAWQKTPIPLSDDDYRKIIKRAIRKLYVDTGRSSVFNNEMFVTDESNEEYFSQELAADEQEYILTCAQLFFFKKVATDVNNIVGYSTDALTVTNADKPYSNLKDTMDRLENERRIGYYRMSRYTMPVV